MYYIYKLKCVNSDDFYIGKTKNIKRRMYVHDSAVRFSEREMYKKIRENGGYSYEIIDETEDNDEGKRLEKYYFETLKPNLNKNYPNRNSKEYYRTFYNERKEYYNGYYLENKDKLTPIRKDYYLKNQEYFKKKNLLNYYNKKGIKKFSTFITYGEIIVNFD